jgi:hypothetical protein
MVSKGTRKSSFTRKKTETEKSRASFPLFYFAICGTLQQNEEVCGGIIRKEYYKCRPLWKKATVGGEEEVVWEVMVDWLHDRLYLAVSAAAPPGELERFTSTPATRNRAAMLGGRVWRGRPFFLDRCDLLGTDCRRLDIVLKRQPEYIQVC